jgi:hypothetical protein
MEDHSPQTVAAMLLGGLGILAGTVTYLFRMLVKQGHQRMADLQAHYDRLLADKARDVANRDAEIARLNKTISDLRDQPPRSRGGT